MIRIAKCSYAPNKAYSFLIDNSGIRDDGDGEVQMTEAEVADFAVYDNVRVMVMVVTSWHRKQRMSINLIEGV